MDVAQEIEPLVYIMSYVFSSGVSFFVIFLQKKYSYILILLHKSPIKTFCKLIETHYLILYTL